MEAASTTSSTASSVDGRNSSVGGSDFLNRGMFSNQQENLLMGSGGSGGVFSLGNGFGNDIGITSGAVSSTGTSFDLSDFPSLSGGVGVAAGSGNGLAAALREQQQILAHQQLLQGSTSSNLGVASKSGSNLYMLAMTGTNGNFQMANEDFPALGGGRTQANSGTVGGGSGLPNVSSAMSNTMSIQPGSSIIENGLYNTGLENGSSQLEGGASLLGSAGLGGLSGLRNTGTALPPVSSGAASAGTIGSSPAVGGSASTGNALSGDYGLLGLLGIIRMTDADRNSLALGSDLQLLGLNLGTTEQIFSTFASPWSDGSAAKEPHYQLPMCYYMQPPALKTGHLSKFQLETLFYIFYALPKDVLQAYAAQELYSREWRYHGELKLWFKRAGPSDGIANPLGGTPQYLYFDINSWERRLFNGSMNQNITNSFLPEDDIRVKFPSS